MIEHIGHIRYRHFDHRYMCDHRYREGYRQGYADAMRDVKEE